ncbi:hypothetical protein BKA70DRAFT_1223780 [Coprinopsis sp. MPI-PUGE-AT-0042]|nr:hypothetical protein BKA70DRAFT_1223780 [Coprinopsis sp. MPI-PUGE-AT-0042]
MAVTILAHLSFLMPTIKEDKARSGLHLFRDGLVALAVTSKLIDWFRKGNRGRLERACRLLVSSDFTGCVVVHEGLVAVEVESDDEKAGGAFDLGYLVEDLDGWLFDNSEDACVTSFATRSLLSKCQIRSKKAKAICNIVNWFANYPRSRACLELGYGPSLRGLYIIYTAQEKENGKTAFYRLGFGREPEGPGICRVKRNRIVVKRELTGYFFSQAGRFSRSTRRLN